MEALPSVHLSQCPSKALEVSLQLVLGAAALSARMLSSIAIPSAKQKSSFLSSASFRVSGQAEYIQILAWSEQYVNGPRP